MVSNVSPTNSGGALFATQDKKKPGPQASETKPFQKDTVQFGQGPLSTKESQQLLLERALGKLRSVVDDARKELGIPEGAIIDPSPEATADRILGFALNFFDRYAENNGLADDEAGRRQFADFIGGAITQGIDEARNILGALNAINPEVTAGIDKTAELIRTGLENFVTNGRQQPAV